MKATIAALGVASCLLLAACTNPPAPGSTTKPLPGKVKASLTISTDQGAQVIYTDGLQKVTRKVTSGKTVINLEVDPDYLIAVLAIGGKKDDDLSCEITVGTRTRSEAATGSAAVVTCLAQPGPEELPVPSVPAGAKQITMVASSQDSAWVGWTTTLDRGSLAGVAGTHSQTASSPDGTARMVVISEGRDDQVSCSLTRPDGAVAKDAGSGAVALALCRLAAR